MRVVLFGATGMVGQGVLRECLRDPDVESVLAIGRAPTAEHHPKLRQIVQENLFDFSSIEGQLSALDACFFCLGISSAGMREEQYRRITHDITLAAAQTLVRLNPGMVFLFVSGAGTDSTGRGRTMWARVKGQTENVLLALPFKAAYMVRPAVIQPLHGIRSKTTLYQAFYTVMAPIFPLLKVLLPRYVTTTEQLGRAMIAVARDGAPKRILENADINRVPVPQ